MLGSKEAISVTSIRFKSKTDGRGELWKNCAA
jgi:hypothetical protein